MGEATRWQRRVEGFVLDQIGEPPARVLEVGSGKGDLAVTLARAGYSVTAIDPGAPEGPIFRRVGIEEFSEPGPFDHVVAILSQHHIEDVGGALDKIVGLIRAGGTLIVVEFAWDRIDITTARWAFARLPKDRLGPLPYSSTLGIIATGGIGTFSGPALAAFVMAGATLQAIAA